MKHYYLVNYLQTRNNNFDLIRFIAATLVIFSHAYPLTQGVSSNEPLTIFTRNQYTFGSLGVAIFFVISGLLITQSFERSSSLMSYMKSRVLRIFPGLFGALLFAALIIAPILSTSTLTDYFSSISLYRYFIGGITLIPELGYSLPGLFESNPHGTAVNGSLWTLKYEFFFYLCIACLGVIKILTRKFILLLFIACLVLSSIDLNIHLHLFFQLASYFLAGSTLYIFREKIPLNGQLAIISFFVILITSQLGFFTFALATFGSYLVIYLGYQQKIQFSNFAKYGDFSYGLYIYAFPVQQSLITLFDSNMSPLLNFSLAFPITLLLAYFSWTLIEKKALKLKHKTTDSTSNHSFLTIKS